MADYNPEELNLDAIEPDSGIENASSENLSEDSFAASSGADEMVPLVDPSEEMTEEIPDFDEEEETAVIPLSEMPIEVEEIERKKWPLVLFSIFIALLVFSAAGFAFWQNGTFGINTTSTPSQEESSEAEVSTLPVESEVEGRAPASDLMPEQLRGAYVIAGKDYMAKGEDNTVDSVKEEIEAAMTAITEYNFNAVFIPVNQNGEALYKSKLFEASPLNLPSYDVLTVLIMIAKDHGLKVIGVVDCGVSDGLVAPTDKTTLALLSGEMKTLGGYDFDGYLLDNYAYEEDTEALTNALNGIPDEKEKEAFAEKTVTDMVKQLTQALLKANPISVVGVVSDPVWATKATNEDGIDVDDEREMLVQGHANVRDWIQNKAIDMVLVKNYRTLEDKALSFKTINEWWGKVCDENQVLFYTSHAVFQMGQKGWESPDEIALQWSTGTDTLGWRGGVFYALSDLQKDWEKSTSVLINTMAGSINLEDLTHKLTMSSPKNTDVSTDESGFVFEGTADPNFPLLMNGKTIKLSEHGLFAKDVTLKMGRNTFVFEHKGKKVTYTINYEPELVKSISPTKDLTLPGEAAISISAICYKGASVSASINGKTITMSKSPIKKNETEGNTETNYENFSGEYTLPAAKEKAQDLGAISFTVSLGGSTKTLKGGHLIVKATEVPKEEENNIDSSTTTSTKRRTTTTTTMTTTTTKAVVTTNKTDKTTKTTKPTTTTTTKVTTTTHPSGNYLLEKEDGKLYYYIDGEHVLDTLLFKHTDGKWYYVKDGVVDWDATLLVKHTDKKWYYVCNGVIDNSATLLFKHTDGKWYYVNKGVVDKSATILFKHTDGKWYYVNKGVVDKTATLIFTFNGKDRYIKNGVWQSGFTGDAVVDGKTYSITNGNVNASNVIKSGKIIKITSAYAETFDNKINDYSNPKNSHLPAGTLDVLTKTVYDSASGNTYYLLNCGRRVYDSAATVYQTSGNITKNSVSASSSSVGGNYTTLTLASNWEVPYALNFYPQSYPYENKMGRFGPLYDISSFTANYIDIHFYYTYKATGSFNVSGSPVLSSSSWITNSDGTYTLRLNMKRTGYFSGYTAEWSGKNLIFRFRHACKASTNSTKPLSGMTIMVDPGHGGPYPGTNGVIPGLYEKTLTLKYGLTLKTKLENLGATVIMTRSTDVFHELYEIQAMARSQQPDLFISCHMNGVDAASANGPSVHYYNEWSKSLAKTVYSRLRSAYLKKNPDSTYRGNLDGGNWDPFAVTRISDCPSILIEFGFMTNAGDEDLLITDSFRSALCTAVTNGVVDYEKTVQR
ncbi:MAG: N-acetylmuramoyl-L-alanine amidase [Clostridia bacterium]|nr:N-acetylmuramoyl-L-alanine amidase [Clostridia bacterium]